MNILVDENIPLSSVHKLLKMGHGVLDIRGTSDEGMSDELLFGRACEENRLLVTTDRDFASFRDRNHYGILIIALRKPNSNKITRRVIDAIERFSDNEWPGMLVVMRDEVMSTWKLGGYE
jgi:predicted nuclease of predicted toxin-antitoxin system